MIMIRVNIKQTFFLNITIIIIFNVEQNIILSMLLYIENYLKTQWYDTSQYS